jgi:hypothetical protein
MKADAILMHRTKNIIAVRAQQSETSTIVQVRRTPSLKNLVDSHFSILGL